MAKSETIKTTIDANINTNGNQAITGAVMNSVLKQMVDSTDAQLTELLNETDNKFAGVETELDNLKKGEAYVIEETLVFRNYATAQIVGNTLTL